MVESVMLATMAAGGSAATATTVGSIAGGLATAGSALSTILPVVGAVGSVMGGQQQASAYKAQARQSELAAKQEELRGREQADNIRRSLQATLASQNAAFAARGISPFTGTPLALSTESRNQASRDIDIARFGAGQAAGALRGQAGQQRIEASSARTSGYTQAASMLYKGGSLL